MYVKIWKGCGTGQHEPAWRLASSVLAGAALGRALEHVVRGLAETCVRTQQRQYSSLPGAPSSADATAGPEGGTRSALCKQWKIVQHRPVCLLCMAHTLGACISKVLHEMP